MKKMNVYTEIAYLLGIIFLALGTALMEKADLGMSMVVAPAYLLYQKFSPIWNFLTFGRVEYILQACLIVIMTIVLRKFKISYLFSFVTAVIYGFTLDGFMACFAFVNITNGIFRLIFFMVGMILCAVGVAFIFRTYISPEAYELFVKEVSAKFHYDINRFKLGYDCVSCLIGIILSFSFYGLFQFEGVKFGTIFCALVNGRIIGILGKTMDRHLDFKDRFSMRKYFEG